MNIGFYTPKESRTTSIGYGTAAYHMISSLQSLGHTVKLDWKEAPVQISFCNPYNYRFNDGQYKIGYTPWESTTVPAPWLPRMNECDEVWATSQWVADVYRDNGVKPPIYVYEHGIDPMWQPIERKPDGVVKFLHIGEPALRKGGQMALDAFREAFGDREDVHLTMKFYYQNHLRAWNEEGFGRVLDYKNVTLIGDSISKDELIKLYGNNDVMVYPSYGEGFGFIPLQALATGMPCISTRDWAPYMNFLGPLAIEGRWERSIWSVHPGNVLYPSYPQLVKNMQHAAENIEHYHTMYYKQAPEIHREYNWLERTEKSWAHIVERFTDN